jgi:TolB-like protein/Tfp pilus assembly protein PilF
LIYSFEDFSLDSDRRELRHGEDLVAVEPQVFELLHYLICNRDRIVSKDDLIAGVWDGRIVSESTLSSRLTAVRQAVGDSGETQRLIRTIPRKGFRFIGQVTEQKNDLPPPDSRPTYPQAEGLRLPDKPSIAVLPFRNLSDDIAQEYFVDGIVEDITIALSQFSQLFVVARSSSFTYKGRNVEVKQIGQELGVRYVLEGSIRKAAGQVRITVQLINSRTAVQLWAAHFDGALDQVFDLQDQVTSGVVGVIAPKIEQAEIERAKRKPTSSLDAYDYYLHGLASLYQDTKEANDKALRLFGKAIELDPNFAAAYGMSALCYVSRQWKQWMVEPQKEVSEAARLVNRAAESGRNDAMALSAAGMAAGLVVRDLDRAVVLLDRSLFLNPNLAISWLRSAWVRIFLGEFDLAIEHASRAMRLSPLDPFLVGMQSAIAFAYFCAGQYDRSAVWAEKAVKEQPTFAPALRVLAASSASLGRMKEATEALVQLREIKAIDHISDLRHLPFREPKYLAKYADALRKAGFPE